jgi:hypothetical protein
LWVSWKLVQWKLQFTWRCKCILPIFCTFFFSDLDKIWYRSCPLKLAEWFWVLWKLPHLWHKWSLFHTFHRYCLIWLKFGIRGLHIMLFSIGELHENQPNEGCTFFAGINEIAFTRVPWNCFDILKVMNALVRSVYCATDYAIFNLVWFILPAFVVQSSQRVILQL